MDNISQGELFMKKSDGTYEKVIMNMAEPIQLTLDEDNEESDRIFRLLTNPMEFSCTFKLDPVEELLLRIKMFGGEYWRGKVPRVIRKRI